MLDTDESINELVQRLSMLLVSMMSDSVPVAGQIHAVYEAKALSEDLAAIVFNQLQQPQLAAALQDASEAWSLDSLADATIDAAAQFGL